MSTSREQFFLCSLTTRSRRVARPVRAWDEREAALLFKELLEDEGMWGRGKVAVEPMIHRPGPSTMLSVPAPG